MKYVAFDLDGVLCDAVLGFTTWLSQEYGGYRHSTGAQRVIDSQEQTHSPFGLAGHAFTEEQVDEMWKWINSNPTFWETLPLLATPHEINDVWTLTAKGYGIVYVTSRKQYAKPHTKTWLVEQGLPMNDEMDVPFLHLTKDKAGYFKQLTEAGHEIVAMIDDRPNQLQALRDAQVPVVVMDQRYNRHVVGLPRVSSVSEYVALILEDETFAKPRARHTYSQQPATLVQYEGSIWRVTDAIGHDVVLVPQEDDVRPSLTMIRRPWSEVTLL